MHNSYLCAGCDVSADWIDVARGLGSHLLADGAPEHRRFPNDATGHAALCRWLRDEGHPVRIAVEASGVYSLDLTVERAREKNRLRAAQASQTTSPLVTNDIEVNLRHLDRRVDEMVRQALKVVERSARITAAYGHLTSVRGIAAKSAVMLLGELLCLPEGMSVREWVAHAGLDVRKHRSGRSVEERPRISKEGNVHVRRALYMPALVSVRHEPAVGAFYERLVEQGKPKMVAVVAVMRKLLHAIYGMLKHDADFDGARCFQAVPVRA